jgi:hypothetical protein
MNLAFSLASRRSQASEKADTRSCSVTIHGTDNRHPDLTDKQIVVCGHRIVQIRGAVELARIPI